MLTQGFGALAPQPVGPSGQLGKEQTLADAEDLFSRYGVWVQSIRQRASRRNALSRCWTAWIRSRTGRRHHWNSFRGSWGIWRLRSHRWGCSIWDRFNTGSMAESRGGRGRAARCGSKSLQPAAKPSPCSQTFHSLFPSGTGLQAHCGLHGCLRQGLGGHVQRACSVGGLDGSPTALAYQLPRVAGSTPGLEPSQETLTRRARTGPYGQHCDRCVHQPTRWSTLPSQLARHLLLWSRKHLRSLRAIHIPGLLNRTADELSRAALPGEWRLHPQTVQLIWRRFGLAQVDPFASPETSHCQLFYSLTEGTLGTDALAHSWPRGLRKYAFPPVSLLAQTLCKVREEEEQILLVAPYWPTRTWFPELMLLVTAPPWQIPLRKDLLPQRRGTLWHPRPDLWKLHVWSLDGTRRF